MVWESVLVSRIPNFSEVKRDSCPLEGVLDIGCKLLAMGIGHQVYLFCDNDSVVDTVVHQKPSNPDMLSLLREYLYVVCLKKFFPIPRKIDTKSNFLADHISRRYDSQSAEKVFESAGKLGMVRVTLPESSFKLSAPW